MKCSNILLKLQICLTILRREKLCEKQSDCPHVFNTKKQSNIPWQTSHLGHCGHWAASREKGKTEKNCVCVYYHYFSEIFLFVCQEM